ncbi:hypothetical protein H6P81_015943 [Aristolochia fimbriata]|uniref:RNA-directed DNA polymerase n=1 Tax=Aristolochia fimbriata TaxID=158543 RepID=A0AAV7EBJ2_ARIFI|nr:hypothetical protein H6P81_015943 [Aristolochia fimbriata]
MTRSRVESPQEIDPEPERALRQRLKENQNQSTPKDQEDMENIEGTHEEQRPRRMMEDYITRSPNTNRTSIITPTVQANNFNFTPQILVMLQTHYQFSGLANEYPNDHLERFLDLCATLKYNGVSDDAARLRLFKFTLARRAKTWLNTLPAGSIATWEDLQKKFLSKMDPYSNTYNAGKKNHPNFSWNNANQARRQPPGFKPLPTNAQQKEELLATKAELEEEKKLNRAMYAELQSLRQSVTLLTTQVNHLNQGAYERPRGALPSNSEVNPKEQVKAITLRSGKTLEKLQPKEQPDMEEEKNPKGGEEQEREKVSPSASPRKKKGKDALPITDIDIRHLPYPSRAQTDILESSFARFLETFKNLKINFPLLEAVKQMPLYGKFLKEILSVKRKMEEQGASVNLMPLSLCKYLELGEPQETGITLQFADRSTKIPEGVMEDVLVKIQDFIYPCNFVVLDMKVDKNLPIILGRPFLATAGSIIDCKQGNLTLRLNNDTISFNIKEAMKQPAVPHDDFCLSIDVIDSCIAEIEEEERIGEGKEGGLVNSEEKEDGDPIMAREVDELEAESKEEGINEEAAQEAPKPKLKPLPNNLKYVFLEKNDKPVIISSCLTGLEEKKLIEHLELVLERCEEKKLVLNWEKCHFMVIVWTDHAALRYLFAKKDSKPRLIRWILLLQEFDIEIKDKKRAENVVADHLSKLEAENKEGEILELFPDELICQVNI